MFYANHVPSGPASIPGLPPGVRILFGDVPGRARQHRAGLRAKGRNKSSGKRFIHNAAACVALARC